MGVEGPIFCRQKINYLPQYDITGFRPAGRTIHMIQNHRQLVKIEIDAIETEKRIDICRSDGQVIDFWVDDKVRVSAKIWLKNKYRLFLPIL